MARQRNGAVIQQRRGWHLGQRLSRFRQITAKTELTLHFPQQRRGADPQHQGLLDHTLSLGIAPQPFQRKTLGEECQRIASRHRCRLIKIRQRLLVPLQVAQGFSECAQNAFVLGGGRQQFAQHALRLGQRGRICAIRIGQREPRRLRSRLQAHRSLRPRARQIISPGGVIKLKFSARDLRVDGPGLAIRRIKFHGAFAQIIGQGPICRRRIIPFFPQERRFGRELPCLSQARHRRQSGSSFFLRSIPRWCRGHDHRGRHQRSGGDGRRFGCLRPKTNERHDDRQRQQTCEQRQTPLTGMRLLRRPTATLGRGGVCRGPSSRIRRIRASARRPHQQSLHAMRQRLIPQAIGEVDPLHLPEFFRHE